MWHIVLYILQRLVYFIFHSSCTCSICVLMYISYGIIMGRFLISDVFWGTTIVLVRASMVRGLLEEIRYWCWQLVGLFRLAPFYLKLTEFIFAFHRKGFFFWVFCCCCSMSLDDHFDMTPILCHANFINAHWLIFLLSSCF